MRVFDKWKGDFSSKLSKIGSESNLGVFGEMEGLISGHLRVRTSKDWYRCLRMVTNH